VEASLRKNTPTQIAAITQTVTQRVKLRASSKTYSPSAAIGQISAHIMLETGDIRRFPASATLHPIVDVCGKSKTESWQTERDWKYQKW